MMEHSRVAILVGTLLGLSLAPLSSCRTYAASSRSDSPGVSVPGAAGTLVLSGRMSSRMTLSMTGAFSLGHALSLDWDLPIVRSMHSSGYSQQIESLSFSFDVPPDSSSDLSIHGRHVRRFHWTAPPANTVIHLVERLRVTVTSTLSPFRNNARYPLAGQAINRRMEQYRRVTPMVRLPSSARSLAAALSRGQTTEQAVVAATANWVASHIRYGGPSSGGASTASSVFNYHQGTCRGYANLMAGLLRFLGIPVQIVYGWVSPGPIDLPAVDHSRSSIQWSTPGSPGELHAWLNIYFPGSGWVPFDPQREKYFVDPRHIAFRTGLEAGDLQLDAWSARAPKGVNPLGRLLSTGAPSIAPADGIGSRVTVHSQDDFHLVLQHIERDVPNVLLLSR